MFIRCCQVSLRLTIVSCALAMLYQGKAFAAVEISSRPTSNMSCSGGMCMPTAKRAVLNVGDLEALLASGDTTISSGPQAQDIEFDVTLRWSSTQMLTLDANRSIFFNKPILITGHGSLTITTNDEGTGGDYRFLGKGHVEFQNLDGSLSGLIINGTPFALVNNMHRLHQAVGGQGVDNFALARSFNAGSTVFSTPPIPVWQRGTIEGLGNTISDFTLHVQARSGRRAHTNGVGNNGWGFIGILGTNSTLRDVGLLNVDVESNADEQLLGGLVGANDGTVKYSFVTGSVSASGSRSFVGGLIGSNGPTLVGSYSTASVSGTGGASAAGGLAGVLSGSCLGGPCIGIIDQSYSTGPVTGGDGIVTGGLVGENLGGTITNSYATGATTAGAETAVGGLIGANTDDTEFQSQASVRMSYSTGQVTGGSDTSVGGLVGQDTATASMSETYWDLDTSGVSAPTRGAGNIANDPGITGLTTVQFTSGLPSGFKKKVWSENPSVNGGYPFLADVPPP